jgi:hypothetical protein
LRHYLARQAGRTNRARAALSPIACSWSGIDRLTDAMENPLLGVRLLMMRNRTDGLAQPPLIFSKSAMLRVSS